MLKDILPTFPDGTRYLQHGCGLYPTRPLDDDAKLDRGELLARSGTAAILSVCGWPDGQQYLRLYYDHVLPMASLTLDTVQNTTKDPIITELAKADCPLRHSSLMWVAAISNVLAHRKIPELSDDRRAFLKKVTERALLAKTDPQWTEHMPKESPIVTLRRENAARVAQAGMDQRTAKPINTLDALRDILRTFAVFGRASCEMTPIAGFENPEAPLSEIITNNVYQTLLNSIASNAAAENIRHAGFVGKPKHPKMTLTPPAAGTYAVCRSMVFIKHLTGSAPVDLFVGQLIRDFLVLRAFDLMDVKSLYMFVSAVKITTPTPELPMFMSASDLKKQGLIDKAKALADHALYVVDPTNTQIFLMETALDTDGRKLVAPPTPAMVEHDMLNTMFDPWLWTVDKETAKKVLFETEAFSMPPTTDDLVDNAGLKQAAGEPDQSTLVGYY